ncbi:MAG TPA: hypothetical protein VG096_07285 [Bryobacteraceae bacterium]|jgi:hypothetical protein|nr:hypothetical protein [Bryobacteraceae bacterium]
MKRSILTLWFAILAALLAAGQLGAQSANATKSAVPRAADGKPDLTGVWQPASTIRGSWEEANTGTGLGGTGKDSSAPVAGSSADRHGEGAPYQPWAAKKVLESFNKRGIDDPTARCLPAGIPRLHSFGLFPVQIVQTPKQVIILYEYMNVFRVIPLNAKHSEDAEPAYLGDSVGHWEGDTLVVDITSFNDKTWLLGAGTFHSDKLHITERFTRVDKDQINYDVVMEDPNVLTKPWPYHSTMMLRDGTRLHESVCAENNLDPDRYEQLLKQGVKIERQ